MRETRGRKIVRVQDARIRALRRYLDTEGTADVARVAELVGSAWPALNTDGNEAKVWRLEQPAWHRSTLRFVIERHGAIVGGGSTRAELEHWAVDLESLSAGIVGYGYRQLYKMQPRMDMRGVAVELAEAVNSNPADPRLRWFPDGSVQPVLARSCGIGPKRTIAGRSQRLSAALGPAMTAMGWLPSGKPGRFVRGALA
jgi:hypothetical protein